MNPWMLISLAVLANVTTNVLLKRVMAAAPAGDPKALLGFALGSASFWAAIVAGLVLLGSYTLSLRAADLSTSYATVTSGALVLITLTTPFFAGEDFSLLKMAGVAAIVLGIVVITVADRTA